MIAYQRNLYLELIECLTTGLLTPFFSGEGQKVQYNYAFIAVDSFNRFKVCYALKSISVIKACVMMLCLNCGNLLTIVLMYHLTWVQISQANSRESLRSGWGVLHILIHPHYHHQVPLLSHTDKCK